jgi:hypothetical protein
MTKIKSSSIYTNISKASELKEWFINNKILKQSSDKLEINNNYKNYFIIENYRGTQNIKYKKDVLDLIAGNSIFGSVTLTFLANFFLFILHWKFIQKIFYKIKSYSDTYFLILLISVRV